MSIERFVRIVIAIKKPLNSMIQRLLKVALYGYYSFFTLVAVND